MIHERKCPLNRDIWDRFIANRLSDEEHRALEKHPETECSDCAEFFNELGPTVTNMGLLWAAESVQDRLDQMFLPSETEQSQMLAEIVEQIKPEPDVEPLFKSRFFQELSAVSTLVAVVISVMLFGIILQSRDSQRTKGAYIDEPGVVLQAAVLRGGSGSTPERGIRRKHYRSRDILFFRYELSSASYVYFFRADDRGKVFLLHPSDTDMVKLQGRGVYEFREKNKTKGFTLLGLQGRYIFFIFATRHPMHLDKELKDVIIKYIAGKQVVKSSDWMLDSFEIFVEEENGQ